MAIKWPELKLVSTSHKNLSLRFGETKWELFDGDKLVGRRKNVRSLIMLADERETPSEPATKKLAKPEEPTTEPAPKKMAKLKTKKLARPAEPVDE